MSASAENLPKYREENARLPKDENGQIASPRYANASYRETWRKWLQSTPKDQYPKWLSDDLKVMKAERRR